MDERFRLEELFEDLKRTSSTNDKKALIEAFFSDRPADTNACKILSLYLDPDCTFGVSKKSFEKAKELPSGGKIEGVEELETLLLRLVAMKERAIKGNCAIEVCSLLWNIYDELAEIVVLKKPCGAAETLFNECATNVYGKPLFDNFQVQLADKYEPARFKKYGVDFYYATPKLDGLRATYREGELWTRGRKPVFGFDHIKEELKHLAQVHELDLIDGELYSQEVPFSEIQGTVVKKKDIDPEKKRRIFFNMFACTGKNIKNTPDMQRVIDTIDASYRSNAGDHELFVRPLCAKLIKNDPDLIKAECEANMALGFEGVMLRHPEVHYFYDRSKYLLKYKLFKESDFRVVQLLEGEGKYAGMLGKVRIEGELEGEFSVLTIQNKNGEPDLVTQKVKGKVLVVSDCGSGFKDEEREYFWKHPEELLGKLIEVKYQELSKSEDNEFYSLRFPIFLKVKEDR